MKILILHQYFKLPDEGGGVRSYYIAKALAEAGHHVEVISAHNCKEADETFPEGFGVHYLKVKYSNRLSFSRRLISFFYFYRKAYNQSRKLKSPDVVYAISTPLSVGWLGRKLSAKWKAKFIFEIGDLWPEVPIQLGIVRSPLLKRVLYSLEKKIITAAHKVITLSPPIADYVQAKGHDDVTTVPNMADIEFFESARSIADQDSFIIGYFGTIGMANQIEYLLSVAKICQSNGLAVQFRIMGDGMRKLSIEEEIRSGSIQNVRLIQYGNMEDVRNQMRSCHAVFLSFQNVPALHTGSPNKLFDGMAASKMIVSNLGGWTKELIEDNNLGFCYDPKSPNEFVDKLMPYLEDNDLVRVCQHNAFQLGKKKYSRGLLCQQVIDLVASF